MHTGDPGPVTNAVKTIDEKLEAMARKSTTGQRLILELFQDVLSGHNVYFVYKGNFYKQKYGAEHYMDSLSS